jgi:hypothetical protein
LFLGESSWVRDAFDRPAYLATSSSVEIVYMDESGDDGMADGASPLFVLCAVRVAELRWQEVARAIAALRARVQRDHGLPAEVEVHARALLLRKHPYRDSPVTSGLLSDVCEGVAELARDGLISVDAWAVNKPSFSGKPLAAALVPALALTNGHARVVFSDQGRIGVMRDLHRMAVASGVVDDGVVESVLGLSSAHSPFIQVADLFATAAYLAVAREEFLPRHARMRPEEVSMFIKMSSGPNRRLHRVPA